MNSAMNTHVEFFERLNDSVDIVQHMKPHSTAFSALLKTCSNLAGFVSMKTNAEENYLKGV